RKNGRIASRDTRAATPQAETEAGPGTVPRNGLPWQLASGDAKSQFSEPSFLFPILSFASIKVGNELHCACRQYTREGRTHDLHVIVRHCCSDEEEWAQKALQTAEEMLATATP